MESIALDGEALALDLPPGDRQLRVIDTVHARPAPTISATARLSRR